MRYLAMVDLGYKEVPEGWVVKASELTEEERKQFTILDNVPFGNWDYDILANEWDLDKLKDWGVEIPELENMEETINENENLTGDYVDHYDFIKKLGGFDKWVEMPGDKKYMIKITNLDAEDDRVTFALQNSETSEIKKMRLPFEKFKDFIYNLQLF